MDERWGRVPRWLKAAGAVLQNAMRGAVRCVFPFFCLAVFAVFVWAVPQGQDVLRGLVERAAGGALAGAIWLGGAVVALSLSVWYAMRWLLTAAMPGLPLDDSPGRLRRWLPRVAGALPGALVAVRCLRLDGLAADELAPARWLAAAFAALALLLLLSFAGRGWLMQLLVRGGWMAPPRGRQASARGLFVPSQLGPDEPLPWVTQVIVGWGLMLSVLLTLLITRFPVGVPEDIGAAAVAGLALASINLSGSFLLTLWPLRHGVPHLAPWALLLAGVFGAVNDNHVVQPSPLAGAAAARTTLQQAFARHLQAQPGARPPVIFVASEGGGIRAAFWTAQVLDALAQEVPDWPARTFALSGVSGGSLGLASWLAVERSRRCPQARHQDVAGLAFAGAGAESVRRRLGADFLTPPVAGMLFYDLIQRLWPWPVGRFDRSRALEQTWQRAHSHLPGRPFERPLAQWYEGCEGLPELMLNTTVVETGQRAVLTRLDPGEAFINDFRSGADDLMSARFSAAAQSAAGLVHHSARFPALSPGGTIERRAPDAAPVPALRLVDGGYFDNSGAQTVADLVETLCRTPGFRPIVLLVRNAPEPLNGRRPGEVAPGRLFPEVGSIVGGLYNARAAHAVAARLALQGRLGDDLIDVAVPADAAAADAPLGWALSVRAQALYEAAATDVARVAGAALRERLAAASNGCERVRDSAAKDAR